MQGMIFTLYQESLKITVCSKYKLSVEHLNRAEDDIQQAILLLQKLQPASASINPILPKKDQNDVDALRQLILKKKQIELSKQVRQWCID